MRKSIKESIVNTINDLNESGLIDKITMKNIKSLCVPDVKEYTPVYLISMTSWYFSIQVELAKFEQGRL